MPESVVLSDEWYEFTQESSMHGLRYTQQRPPLLFRRLIWLLLIGGTLAYFCYAASLFMTVFANKGVNTKIRVETADELEFPTVTVCNKNLWRKNKIEEASKNLGSDELINIIENLYGDEVILPPAEEDYDWTKEPYNVINSLTANETENIFIQAAPRDLISRCKFNGKPISCSDLFQPLKTEGGYCVQLNSNGSLKAVAAGKTSGITFGAFIDRDEYTSGPFSKSEGISLTFHEAHEVPLVPELGLGLASGVEADFILSKSTTNRKPPPADNNRANCFDKEHLSNPLHYYNQYSYSACQVECKTSYVINKCGCRDIFQPALNGSDMCGFQKMLYCSAPAMKEFISDPEGLRSCRCKDACSVSEYSAKLSTTSFPSSKYVSLNRLTPESLKYIQDNVVMINIYYGKMSYYRLDEEFAYGVTDMIANLGGTLGICVGASILSICEFVEFGVRALVKSIKSKRKKNLVSAIKIKVSPQEKEFVKHVA